MSPLCLFSERCLQLKELFWLLLLYKQNPRFCGDLLSQPCWLVVMLNIKNLVEWAQVKPGYQQWWKHHALPQKHTLISDLRYLNCTFANYSWKPKSVLVNRFASLICPWLANAAFDLQWAVQLRGGPHHRCGIAETILYGFIILPFPLQFSKVVWERCLLDGDWVLSRWPAKMR